MEFHYSKTKTLRWNAKVILFIQIYTFLDSDFSTLIENVNNFLFSQDFCAKSSGKLTWKINHGYSPLKQFCPNVVRVIFSFYGDKDNHTILFVCVQNGWAGGHCSSLRKFVRSQPRLGWPLWNICVTNDHGYVPLVANTSRSFPRSWFI